MKVFDGDGPNTEDVAAERKARQKAMTARWRERLKGRGNKSELQVVAEDEPDDETAELVRFYDALQGVEAPYLKRVNWVANHLHVPLDRIDAKDPPDYAAICLLRWANDNENEFRTVYDARLMPSKAELAMLEQAKDDGRALSILADFQEQFDESSNESRSEKVEQALPEVRNEKTTGGVLGQQGAS